MPYTRTQPPLPWHGRSPLAQETSYEGALSALWTAGRKQAQLLAFLDGRGRYGATDHEAQQYFHWPMSSVCSIRNALVDQWLVKDSGRTRLSPFANRVVVWISKPAHLRRAVPVIPIARVTPARVMDGDMNGMGCDGSAG